MNTFPVFRSLTLEDTQVEKCPKSGGVVSTTEELCELVPGAAHDQIVTTLRNAQLREVPEKYKRP